MKENNFVKDVLKLEIHIKTDLCFLLVIPRNEDLVKALQLNTVPKVLLEQNELALKSLLKHIPVYEKFLQKIINFDIALLKGSDFDPNYSDNLVENLNDIKNIFDEIQLYFSKKQQKQEVYEVMEHTKKIISTLIDVVRKISEKK